MRASGAGGGAGQSSSEAEFSVDVVGDAKLTRTPTDGVDAFRSLIEQRGVSADYLPVEYPTAGVA